MIDSHFDRDPNRHRDFSWLAYLSLPILIAGAAWLLYLADRRKSSDWETDQLTYIPSGKFLKPMVLDQDAMAADILWIRGMNYFANSYLEGKSYRWFGHILDVVTTLNPRFHPAYEFAGTVLTKNKVELAHTLPLLEKGVEEFPWDWKLRVFACLARLGLDSNFVQAAEYLKPVSLDTNVPNHIRLLAASLLQKGGGRRIALAFLMDRYLHSNETINREIFLDKMVSLYPQASLPKQVRVAKTAEIIKQVVGYPQFQPDVLTILHEYLADSLSERSARMLKMLDN